MDLLSNRDVATEILSRLPTKSLMLFKCTAKKWNKFISDPLFLRFHYKRSYSIVGLFIQEAEPGIKLDLEPLNFISLIRKRRVVENSTLDFLPEKVALLASSNALLCSRSRIYTVLGSYVLMDTPKKNAKDLVLYVCDPIRKEWISIRPEGWCDDLTFGLASYPFVTSSNSAPSFKVVSIWPLENYSKLSFSIYSSDTGRWNKSEAICSINSKIHQAKVTFANGMLHWLTWDHHVLTFDVEKELPKVIELPGTSHAKDKCRKGICFGQSEGYFHYISATHTELHVWVLKDYGEPTWVRKHFLQLFEFYEENSSLVGSPSQIFYSSFLRADISSADELNYDLEPLAFYNEVLCMRLRGKVFSYSFKSRVLLKHCSMQELGFVLTPLVPIVLTHLASLRSLENFVAVGTKVSREKDS